MHARDRRRERETEPGAGPRARAFESDETVEHARPIFRRDARSPIRHVEFDPVAGAPRGDDDVRPFGRLAGLFLLPIFQRVIHEIGDRLADQLAIPPDQSVRAFRLDPEIESLLLGDGLVEFGHRMRRFIHVKGLLGLDLGARLDARDQEQRIEDLDEIVRFLDRPLERRAIVRPRRLRRRSASSA